MLNSTIPFNIYSDILPTISNEYEYDGTLQEYIGEYNRYAQYDQYDHTHIPIDRRIYEEIHIEPYEEIELHSKYNIYS